MLTYLSIKNFILIDALELELQPNMTVFTGETGSGKTIIIKAIHFASGHKSNVSFIRPGQDNTQVCLQFDITNHHSIQTWLQENTLNHDNECHLRRVLQNNGRTRAYINGHLVSIAQLKALSTQLIEIHGQHAQHALRDACTPRLIIDDYGNHDVLCNTIKNLSDEHKRIHQELKQLEESALTRKQRLEYLQFTANELQTLQLQNNEWEKITTTQKKLASKQDLLTHLHDALNHLHHNDNNLCSKTTQLQQNLTQCTNYQTELNQAHSHLTQAIIHLDETVLEIKQVQAAIELDDQSLANIEARLTELHTAARKYRVEPNELLNLQQKTENEIKSLNAQSNDTEALTHKQNAIVADYNQYAKQLTTAREQTLTEFNKQLTKHMQALNLHTQALRVTMNTDISSDLTAHGQDTLTFMAQPNPGHPPQLLNNIVSGGELSRMSLAIKVTQKQQKIPPLIIFDEIDAGIGGETANKVGRYLKQLGTNVQILVISHLPQVANHAQQRILVQKKITKQSTVTEATLMS